MLYIEVLLYILVDYMDPKLNNVKIHLEAWSPKIPLDSKASGAPFIVFDFHVTNTSTTSAEVCT